MLRDYRISPATTTDFRQWWLPIFAEAIATSDGAASTLEVDVAGAVEGFLWGSGEQIGRAHV